MNKHGMLKATSVAIALCTVMSSTTFAFSTVASAATVDTTEKVSASATKSKDNFSWDNASVYFLLTDRFRNGNTSNDHSYNRGLDQGGKVLSNIDDRATFHGGDFAGVTQSIEEGYFNNLGVNAIWISAPYEQTHGYVVGSDGNPSYAHYSYHGYYVLDYTQTDANFGTAEEFETLVDTAHEHGIRVIMDIVMNHSGYNSLYDMAEYGYGTVAPGWEDSYYSHQNVNNKTYHSFIDYDTNAEDWANWWGPDWIRCGVAGYTEGGGSDLTRSLAGLPDFKTEQASTVGIPKLLQTKWKREGRLDSETAKINNFFTKTGRSATVSNYLAGWLSEWVREYGVDGFRCDTAKHVEFASWKNLKNACVDALKEWRANNPNKPGADWDEDFWMTGECWDHGVNKDGYYTQGGFDSMINFSTQGGGLLSAGRVKGTYDGFAKAINNDDSFNVLSYVSSHDSVLARGDLIGTGSGLLLCPGGIQIFYGDETNRPMVAGVPNDGNGGAGHSLRSDMNWDSMDTNVLEHWQKVGVFRNNHISVGAGSNTSLTSTSGYAFARDYDKNGITDKVIGCIYANANTDVTISVGDTWSDGQYLVNAYDQSSAVVSNGKVTFNSGKNGTILVEEPDGRPLMSVKGDAEFTGTQTVTVSLDKCEQAKCSVDGGNKFIVKDGDTITIGNTAYDGDTITITLEAENEIGSSESKATFKKKVQGGSTAPVKTTSRLVVKTADGSAPYVYAWTGASNALLGAWPGTQLTSKDDNGNYYVDLNTTEAYNVVLNNGGKAQSGDIAGITGDAIITVKNTSFSSYDLEIVETPASPLEQLKKEGREVKAMTSSDYTASSWTTVESVMKSVDALVAQGSDADDDQVAAMITTLQNAKAKLQLNVPALGYAVKGKNTVSGVAAPASKVTVTVNGTAYTTQADDVTGVFTVTTATLNASSKLTFKAERNSVSSAVGAYNMSSGDITSLIVPTTASQATQPTTARPTQPTTVRPTQPTTARPTQPTTVRPTQPTTVAPTTQSPTQGTNLNISSKSNYFSNANVTLKKGDTVCLEYIVDSSMNLVNAEWTLTYDNTKLAVDTSRSTKLMPNVKNEVTNIMSANGKIKSNFTEIQNLADFSNGKALARVYFNVIGTGDTTVDFNLKTLSVGYLDSNYNLKFKPVVRGGVAQTDVTSTPGFENFTIKTSVKAAKATTGSTTTVYFAAPKVAPGKTVWSNVDIYYANTTAVKNSNRIHMKDTGLVVNNPDGDKLKTTTSGEWHVFSAELTEAQVKAIDSAKYAGFVNAGNYNLKTSVKFDITMGKSIADFDGQVFLINAAVTNKEHDSYTGAWSKAEMTKPEHKATTVYFAAPKVAPGKTVWSDVDIYYADTTAVKNSNRIHMKDTGLVVNNPDGDKLKTTTSGEWHVFSAELTEAQVKAIDSAKYAGFVYAGNYNIKTSVKFDITMGKSIADFDGQVFLINAALTNKEVDSYTGAWSKAEMKKPYKTTTLKFAVPTQNWSGGAYFYYGNSSVITSVNKIAMKDSGKTISVPDSLVSSLKNYKGGDWKVYTVDLTAEQVEAIDKSSVAGFCSGSSIYVKTTTTKNVFRDYKSVMDLENYAFVVTGCTNAAQEKTSLTGKWILCKF
ncbi:alpha-amylase family glycosyl hydrolase [Ruminococcus sp.]